MKSTLFGGVSMVGLEDDHRFVGQAHGVEMIEHLPDSLVQGGYEGIVFAAW